jgi:aminopeptidase YwaD
LKIGDVVVQLGEFQISSLENYMEALNKFKKGDKTKVKVKRANDTIESEITF